MLNFRQSISQRYGLRIQEIKGSDLFSIKPEIAAKLRAKIKGRITQL